MKGIPPEIDALLWQLAESGSATARHEFELRHARYGPELARRVRMVAELREAGKVVVHRPKFSPRPTQVAPAPRWAIAGALGMAVLAVGAVAYVMASGEEKPQAASPMPIVPKIRTEEPKIESPVVTTVPEKRESKATVPAPEKPPERTPSYLLPRDVQIADTSLTAAIQLVAVGGGLKVTLAPGFVDQKVSFDYRGSGLNTIETLKAMGEQYGFTVLDEEEGAVLVVPAREPTVERRIGG